MLGKRAITGEALDENHIDASRGIYSASFSEWLLDHRGALLFQGLDKFTALKNQEMIAELLLFPDSAAAELVSWLHGDYVVGTECLTD